MSGKRMLVWLIFCIFICAMVIAALIATPRRSTHGASQSSGAASPLSAFPS